MITTTFTIQAARKELSEPEHADHASVIEMCSSDPATKWRVVRGSAQHALMQLEIIEAGQGNYVGTVLVSCETGPAVDLLRKYAAEDRPRS